MHSTVLNGLQRMVSMPNISKPDGHTKIASQVISKISMWQNYLEQNVIFYQSFTFHRISKLQVHAQQLVHIHTLKLSIALRSKHQNFPLLIILYRIASWIVFDRKSKKLFRNFCI